MNTVTSGISAINAVQNGKHGNMKRILTNAIFVSCWSKVSLCLGNYGIMSSSAYVTK